MLSLGIYISVGLKYRPTELRRVNLVDIAINDVFLSIGFCLLQWPNVIQRIAEVSKPYAFILKITMSRKSGVGRSLAKGEDTELQSYFNKYKSRFLDIRYNAIAFPLVWGTF